MMDMRSLNSLVTDSSAASSSWGSGCRIINGMVNQQGDGTPLTTLYELFGERMDALIEEANQELTA